MNETKDYNVQFVVTSAGQRFTCTRQVTGSETVAVDYPEDFHGGTQDGTYKWQAIVKGKVVLSGWFIYKTVGKPDKCGRPDIQITAHLNCDL